MVSPRLSLQEYIDNAWISISAPVMLVHAYFFITNPLRKEALGCLERYNCIIRWSSMILRLANDLGTSSVCSLIIIDCCSLGHICLPFLKTIFCYEKRGQGKYKEHVWFPVFGFIFCLVIKNTKFT